MEEREKNKTESSTLYLVGTPIGNLADISERALKVLSEVDFIAAEDTRNTLRLLTALGIKKELISYYEHNKRASGERIAARLIRGESCALVTDAGMPAISDPGEDIVKLVSEMGINVSVIPGPCAAISALALSALSTSRFVFEGFLPTVKSERKKRLERIKSEELTVILYEAPHKLKTTLSDLFDSCGGERKISLARELTKLNEEVIRTTLDVAVAMYKEKEPRGEYVLILEGASADAEATVEKADPIEWVNKLVDEGMKKMDAIKLVAKESGVPKSEIYNLFIEND